MLQSTNIDESVHHLQQEIDNYAMLSTKVSEGNWNNEDLKRIKELAIKKCNQKLQKYSDIGEEKYNKVDNIIENIMIDLELV